MIRVAGLLVALLILKQGIVALDAVSPARQEQRRLTELLGLEPAAMFYTEVPVALAAERTLRSRLPGREHMTTRGEDDERNDKTALPHGHQSGGGGRRAGRL